MIKKDIVMLVIASRSDTYDQIINKYWSYLIKYIKENNYSIKIYLIFGNNVKTDDLNLNEDDKLILNLLYLFKFLFICWIVIFNAKFIKLIHDIIIHV